MGFGVLFLLLLGTAGWWLYSRWTAMREAQAARREAEMLFVFEARSKIAPKAAVPAGAQAASDFYPTVPGQG